MIESGTAVGTVARTDEELVEQIQAGSQDALGEFYDRYCDRAYRIAFVVCSRADLAEDAVQDAFLSIWKSSGTYAARRGTVAAWLLTCVRYRAIDLVRRTSLRLQRQAGIENLDDHAAPADTVARVEATRVRAPLELLPDSQREVITLAFYGGLSHSEIAAQLALSSGTVKRHMRLGLHKLRSSLAHNGVKQSVGGLPGSMPRPPQIAARHAQATRLSGNHELGHEQSVTRVRDEWGAHENPGPG